MSVEELAARCGETVEFVRRAHGLGLVGPGGHARFDLADVERVRLLRFMLRRGLDLELIADVERDQGLVSYFTDQIAATGSWPSVPLGQAAQVAGLPTPFLERFARAACLDDQQGLVSEEDIQIVQGLKVALDAGLPQDALLQLVTVYADALGRVADAEHRLFHFYVHERLRAQGLRGRDLLEATISAADRMLELVESTILYFHRKGAANVLREDAVLHLAEETGAADMPQVPGQLPTAVVFVDLAGYSALTEAMGDIDATEVIERFSGLVRPAVARYRGRIVKQIGDEFMVVFSHPVAAVDFALEVRDRAARETRFSGTRTGVHWGPALYREGDYYGGTVNLAARLAATARRHQIVVSQAVRAACDDQGVVFEALGRQRLKGITGDVELFDVRHLAEPTAESPVELILDRVCGMELAPDQIQARLELAGHSYAFCSTSCLRLFTANPSGYDT
jgi:class 3 adenylate cyclase/YHS domain-containing protein